MAAMHRAGRLTVWALFALAGLCAAHAVAYLVMFRCWSCHEQIVSATHALVAGLSSLSVASLALVSTLMAGRMSRRRAFHISTVQILVIEASAFVILQFLERRGAFPETFTEPTFVLEFALIVASAVAVARFARVVEDIACTVVWARPSRRNGRIPRVHVVVLSNGPRATAYGATGFLRAPPLPS